MLPRYRRALLVLILTVLALAPDARSPLPAAAATLTFTVTSTVDSHDANPGDGICADASGHCTVRAAVEEADAQPGSSAMTIRIRAGTYLLTLGQLTLTTNIITLLGAGPGTTTLAGQGSRILGVTGAVAIIGGLTLRHGTAGNDQGGALANQGVTILSRSAVVSGTAANGGGIYNAPTARLALLSSVVVSSSAPGGAGGGIDNQGSLIVSDSLLSGNAALVGGAIASTGALTLTNSSVLTNTSTSPCCLSSGGGGLYTSGTAVVVSSTLSGNTASDGGAIANDFGLLRVISSTLGGNSATSGGGIASWGPLQLTSSTLSGNSANSGGGISNFGPLTMTNSTLSGNMALSGNGGGINSESYTLTVMRSTFSGNSASGNGGGIRNFGAPLTLAGSTLSGNSAANGGAIANDSGLLGLRNSTLSGNSASGSGGGIYNTHAFGALSYVTVASNSTGIANAGPAPMMLNGTIVANSTNGPNCTASNIERQGYNLDSDGSCGFSKSTDVTNTNPILGSLANNGGPTQTMALLPGSPAIDHGGTHIAGCPAVDQRGVTRPQGSACDIGAYEYVPAGAAPAATLIADG